MFKGPRGLSSFGTLEISGGVTSVVDMNNPTCDCQKVGDADDNNLVSAPDFAIMRNTYGLAEGQQVRVALFVAAGRGVRLRWPAEERGEARPPTGEQEVEEREAHRGPLEREAALRRGNRFEARVELVLAASPRRRVEAVDEAAAVLLESRSHSRGAGREATYGELGLPRVDRDRPTDEGVQPSAPSPFRPGARGKGAVSGRCHHDNRTAPSARRPGPSEPASGRT